MGGFLLDGAAERGAGAPRAAGAVRGRRARAAPGRAPRAQLRGHPAQLRGRAPGAPPAAQARPAPPLQAAAPQVRSILRPCILYRNQLYQSILYN